MQTPDHTTRPTSADATTPRQREPFQLKSAKVDVSAALRSSPPPLVHVLPGLLVGTVGMLASPGGKGKTMLCFQMGCALATGTPICGGLFDGVAADYRRRAEPTKVVLLLAEESHAIVVRRLHAIVEAMLTCPAPVFEQERRLAILQLLAENLVVLPCAEHGRPRLFDAKCRPTPTYAQLAELAQDAGLVIVDPLRQLHDGDEVDSGYMTSVMGHLQALVARTQAALLVAHHTSQASSVAGYGDLAQAARGSTAITDAVRFQLNLSTPAEKWLTDEVIAYDDRNRLLRVDIAKANHLPPMPTQLLQRGKGGVLSLLQPTPRAAHPKAKSPARRTVGAW